MADNTYTDDWLNFVIFAEKYGFKKGKNILGHEYVNRGNIYCYSYGAIQINLETIETDNRNFDIDFKQMKQIIFALYED